MNTPFGFIFDKRHLGSPLSILAGLLAGEPGVAQAGTATANLSVSIIITAACTINPATLIFAPTPRNQLAYDSCQRKLNGICNLHRWKSILNCHGQRIKRFWQSTAYDQRCQFS
jgi:hypothetical protein